MLSRVPGLVGRTCSLSGTTATPLGVRGRYAWAPCFRHCHAQSASAVWTASPAALKWKAAALLGGSTLGCLAWGSRGAYDPSVTLAHCEPRLGRKGNDKGRVSDAQDRLIPLEEVRKHVTEESLWVCYNGDVFDITDFLLGHPGGSDRLMMAGGLDMGPFWDVYTEHYRGHVIPFMQRFKIGQLSEEDTKRSKDFENTNPFEDDPVRHPDLLHTTTHPFNGEPRLERLTENFYTPNDLHYVRNHLPVPDIEDEDYELEISGPGVPRPTTFSLDDLKTKFTKYEVTNCYQCAGNRREDFHGTKEGDQQIFISPHWIVGAISNAKWGGARMRDVLEHCGVDVDAMALGKIDPHDVGIKHVQFEGYDATETGMTYGSSVPIDKVLDPHGDCLVAYEMNGVPLPPDHGKPVRAMIPGHAGCRSCKWLNKIILSEKESEKPWQNKSYLGFAPDMRFDNDPKKTPGKALWKWTKDPELKKYLEEQQNVTHGHLGRAICQIQPTTSMICNPPQNAVIAGAPDFIEVKGVAHSFGGNGLNRVDVSIDGGATWTAAEMYKPEDLLRKERFGKMWSWNLFSKKVPLTAEQKDQLATGRPLKLELVSKAVNTCFDVQPERPESYFNARGICINHMYRVPLTVDPNVQRAARSHNWLQRLRNAYYKPGENPAGRTGQEYPNKPTGGVFLEPWVHDVKE